MLSLKKTLLVSSLLVLASCSGDDTDEWNAVEVPNEFDGLILPDSIAQSDTLYGWYLKDMAPDAMSSEKAGSSSGVTNSSGVSSSSAGSCSSGKSSSVSSSSGAVETDGDSVYASEDYADASKVRLLPPAGFYSDITIPVPAPQYGGIIRCTFDGSEPTSVTTAFTSPYTVTKNTADARDDAQAEVNPESEFDAYRGVGPARKSHGEEGGSGGSECGKRHVPGIDFNEVFALDHLFHDAELGGGKDGEEYAI